MYETHHAVLLKTNNLETSAPENEDVEVREFICAQLGIDDARELTHTAYTKPQQAKVQLLVVRTSFITHEAQNALLKLLEEPPVTTRFLFFAPSDIQLLPTLASRLYISEELSDGVENKLFTTFKQASVGERLEQITEYIKKKDVFWQRAIKQGLMVYVGTCTSSKEKKALEFVARLLLTRGASNKMLLEHAALILSRVSSD